MNDDLTGVAPYTNNISSNAHNDLKFWDEVNSYPYISVTAGPETREYMPAAFKWGYLTVTIRLYISDNDDPNLALESLMEDIEKLLDSNRNLAYTSANGTVSETTDLHITSITTDEGLLDPIGVGEVSIEVQYQVL